MDFDTMKMTCTVCGWSTNDHDAMMLHLSDVMTIHARGEHPEMGVDFEHEEDRAEERRRG